jgi:hypothetical protein
MVLVTGRPSTSLESLPHTLNDKGPSSEGLSKVTRDLVMPKNYEERRNDDDQQQLRLIDGYGWFGMAVCVKNATVLGFS